MFSLAITARTRVTRRPPKAPYLAERRPESGVVVRTFQGKLGTMAVVKWDGGAFSKEAVGDLCRDYRGPTQPPEPEAA